MEALDRLSAETIADFKGMYYITERRIDVIGGMTRLYTPEGTGLHTGASVL